MEGKKDNHKRLKSLKSEISTIRKELNKLNVEKEKWFAKKEDQKKEIADFIKKIKELKVSKDSVSTEIKELKEKRDKYNKEVQDLIESYKKLSKKKEEFLAKTKIASNPDQIMDTIEKIEKKIETEVLPFHKEQTLMKQLKSLKKALAETAGIKDVLDAIRGISEQITIAKDKAQRFHNKLRTGFVQNKDSYSEFMKLTKKITKLKKEQEESFGKFINAKKEFAKVNNDLKEKLMESKGIQEKLGIIKVGKQKAKKQKMTDELKKKSEEVEEKIKTKKKLTTEDLLVFQKMEEEKDVHN